ncbi:MAG: chromate efflux transporter [Anaerolineales bacterium]
MTPTPAFSSESEKRRAGTERIGSIVRLFFKLGVVGFGGPAAHIAMMEEEVVSRRGWLSRDHFLDLVGATNLIPGPNSTEMAIHIGYIRAGLPGLLAAGASFIVPAFAITTALAWAYVQYGSLPAVQPFLVGIKPAVLAIILGAVVQLGRSALRSWQLAAVGAGVLIAVLLGANEMVALLLGAVAGMFISRSPAASTAGVIGYSTARVHWHQILKRLAGTSGLLTAGSAAVGIPLVQLGFFFLKVGAVLYGSGYVLVAFLEGGLVHDLGWLTQRQLLDAVSAGQFTPGPVLSTSAFVGYLLAGFPGAFVSAGAIFTPSFFFVLALNPLIPKLRSSAWTAAFLDAANVSAVALMAAVSIRLGYATLVSWPSWFIALAAIGLRLRFRLSPSLLVIGGGLVGWLIY